MTYEDMLARNQQRFIMRRRRLLRTWRVVGPLLLLLLIIAGVIWLLIRYKVIRLSFLSPGPESYAVAPPSTSQAESEEHETDEGAV